MSNFSKIECITLVCGAHGYFAGKVCLGHGAVWIFGSKGLLFNGRLSIPEHALAIDPPV